MRIYKESVGNSVAYCNALDLFRSLFRDQMRLGNAEILKLRNQRVVLNHIVYGTDPDTVECGRRACVLENECIVDATAAQ